MTNERMTAAELLAELELDPEYQASLAEKNAALAKAHAELLRLEAPLLADLKSAGFEMDSIWDLVNTTAPYPEAIPVLFEHLGRDYPGRIKEAIVRALAVPEAISGWDALIDLFLKSPDASTGGMKFAAGVALAGAASDDVIADVMRLAADPTQGVSRLALIGALRRSAKAEAKMLLLKLREDPQLAAELKKLRRLDRLRREGPR